MRELIDQQNRGATRERGIEIQLLPHDIPVANADRRQVFETFEQPLGFNAAVRLDVSDHHIRAAGTRAAGRLEHRVGLADTCGGAEKNTQTPAPRASFLYLEMREELIGIRSHFHHQRARYAPCSGIASSARFSSSTFTRGSPRK